MLSTPTSIISSKNVRTLFGSAPSNRVVFVVTRKPAATASRIPSSASSYPPSRHTENRGVLSARRRVPKSSNTCSADRCSFSFSSSAWCRDRYISCAPPGLQQSCRSAMHQRLAARNRHHRRFALVDRLHAVFHRKVGLQNVRGY